MPVLCHIPDPFIVDFPLSMPAAAANPTIQLEPDLLGEPNVGVSPIYQHSSLNILRQQRLTY
jgi:hypothetical protein